MVLKRSPWGDDEESEENIFTKKRKKNKQINFDNFQFEFNSKIAAIIVAAFILLWLSSGIYKVNEGEQSVILRFGQFSRNGTPGLNYHLPAPFEKRIVEMVDKSRRIEIGYRSTGAARTGGAVSSRDIKPESIMLTGDENIVSLHVDVMWHINDLIKYTFNIENQTETVKAAAESAIREVIGNIPITAVLSNKKQMIADKMEKLMMQILNQYDSGVEIEQVKLLRAEPPEEVIAAYRDVQTAKADKEKVINESEAYQNDILPRARGAAAKIIQEAQGYEAEVIAKAKGDVSRFDAIYKQYVANKNVMRERLYLESAEEILQNSDKIIMGGDGMLPHMNVKQKNN